MQAERTASPGLVSMIQRTLGSPLKPGELGVIMARAGVGKTACLTHMALEQLLRGEPVLHVCIDEIPDKIKVWYKEFLKNLAEMQQGEDIAKLQTRIEPLRFILSYLHQTFRPEKLDQSLVNLKEQAGFFPQMLVLDGLDFDRVSRSLIEELGAFADRHGVSIWMSARTHRHMAEVNDRGIPYPCHQIDDLFEAVVLLDPSPEAIHIQVLKHGNRYRPDHPLVLLNPQTYLLLEP